MRPAPGRTGIAVRASGDLVVPDDVYSIERDAVPRGDRAGERSHGVVLLRGERGICDVVELELDPDGVLVEVEIS